MEVMGNKRNIWVLPTDKPSNLFYIKNKLQYSISSKIRGNNEGFNIYITSDEEIKEGDWFIHYSDNITTLLKAIEVKERIFDDQGMSCHINFCKKIILTTNQDLIKDGVQAIDDDFLNWFVNNSNCENVEIKKEYITPLGDIAETCYDNERLNYKIIIPKEETCEYFKKIGCIKDICSCNINPKKPPFKNETLEEAAETKLYQTINKIIDGGKDLQKGYNVTRGQAVDYAFEIALKVAKWQQERMYSEEEVLVILHKRDMYKWEEHLEILSLKEWFEQFKKK